MIRKILCWLGYHEENLNDGRNHCDYKGNHIFITYYCKHCGKEGIKKTYNNE